MRLKNFLLVVEDIERAKSFYKELFGLDVVRDFDTNVILAQGLVLQERTSWEQAVNEQVQTGGRDVALYFEEYDLEEYVKKVERSEWNIHFLNPLQTLENGQKMIRFCDPDGHVIEIREIEIEKF
ncbi:MAG: VOC family protein [Lachnospiraceae bacterium]|nr:VOC family protein [Lachnospiraceae bacterium]